MVVEKIIGQNLSLGQFPQDRFHWRLGRVIEYWLHMPYFSKHLSCKSPDLALKNIGCPNAIFGIYLY